MQQIKDLARLVGKTITRTHQCYDDYLFVFFSDETFCAFRAKNGWEGESEIEMETDDLQNPSSYTVEMLRTVGVITQEEYNIFMAAEKAEHDRIMQETEIRKLQELKLKYPNA